MVSLHPPKRYKNKTKYINYDIDEINYKIYNDLPLKSYQEKLKIDWNIKHLMYEGETYKRIEEINSGHHYITSNGRVINAKRCLEISINNIKDKYLAFHCEQQRWKLEELMPKYDYEYDFDKLIKYYKSINYKLTWVKG